MDKKKQGPRKGCVYEDMTSTVSGTECTGLMPTPPQDEDCLLYTSDAADD